MPTNYVIEATARELAERRNRDWTTMEPGDKYGFYQMAVTKLASPTIIFPLNVRQSYCNQQTMSRLVQTPHGTVRVTLQVPVRQLFVCRTSEGDRVYPGIRPVNPDAPCGPECVNK